MAKVGCSMWLLQFQISQLLLIWLQSCVLWVSCIPLIYPLLMILCSITVSQCIMVYDIIVKCQIYMYIYITAWDPPVSHSIVAPQNTIYDSSFQGANPFHSKLYQVSGLVYPCLTCTYFIYLCTYSKVLKEHQKLVHRNIWKFQQLNNKWLKYHYKI